MSEETTTESPQKGRKYEREKYTKEEIEALLECTSSNAPSAIRNHALITTLWQSGLRVSEALDLRESDVDLIAPEIHVRHGKGDKSRHVTPGPAMVPDILKWLAVRRTLDIPEDATLFCTLKGKRLKDTYLRNVLGRLAVKAKWTKRIHPHGFRHTFAAHLANRGVPTAHIQRQLGHSSLATTSVYLTTISNEDVAQEMRKVEW